MKLRELFDKLTPGQLDTSVAIKLIAVMEGSNHKAICTTILPLKRVEIQDDGSVFLVTEE